MSIRIIDRKDFEKTPQPSDRESAKNILVKKNYTNQKTDGIKFSAKPWGFEYLCFRNRHFDIWELHINPQSSTSSHIHKKKDSLMIMIEGEVVLSTTNEKDILMTGDFRLSKRGTAHQIINVGNKIAHILEIESPPDRNDLIRIDDSYGRKGLPYDFGQTKPVIKKMNLRPKKFFQGIREEYRHFDFFKLIHSSKKEVGLRIFGIVCRKEVCLQSTESFNLLQKNLVKNSLHSFLVLQGNASVEIIGSATRIRKPGDCFTLSDTSKITRLSRNSILIGWR